MHMYTSSKYEVSNRKRAFNHNSNYLESTLERVESESWLLVTKFSSLAACC